MKTVMMKVFLIAASLVCMLEGLVLVDVGLGRLPPDRAVDLYVKMFQTPHGLQTVLGVGLLFIVLGFILIMTASRTKPAVRMIEVVRSGKILKIPYVTIKDFIEQIIGQNPYITDFSVDFEAKGKGAIDIMIVSGFKDVPHIHRELNLVEEILKNELERVFEWKDFAFHFQLGEVSVSPNKKYFGDDKTQETPGQPAVIAEQPAAIAEQPSASPEIEEVEMDRKEGVLEEASVEESEKEVPKARSKFAAMLWGKR